MPSSFFMASGFIIASSFFMASGFIIASSFFMASCFLMDSPCFIMASPFCMPSSCLAIAPGAAMALFAARFRAERVVLCVESDILPCEPADMDIAD